MSFPYRKIAVFGATSGIGRSLAECFLKNNIYVIAIGRRQDRLDELVSKHGNDRVEGVSFDITNFDAIPEFVKSITSKHSDIDLVFLNSGVQYGHDLTQPEGIKLSAVNAELNTNFMAPVHFTLAFLPFLKARAKEGKPAGIFYTTSALALVPQPLAPIYSATKAAMHAFILSLRAQIEDTGVKVLELFPPLVQTEIHGEEGQGSGMPVQEFTDQAWKLLSEGKDQIPVGFGQEAFDNFEMKRQKMFQTLADRMLKGPHHSLRAYD